MTMKSPAPMATAPDRTIEIAPSKALIIPVEAKSRQKKRSRKKERSDDQIIDGEEDERDEGSYMAQTDEEFRTYLQHEVIALVLTVLQPSFAIYLVKIYLTTIHPFMTGVSITMLRHL